MIWHMTIHNIDVNKLPASQVFDLDTIFSAKHFEYEKNGAKAPLFPYYVKYKSVQHLQY